MDLLRQRDLVPHSKMASTNFVVIGAGAIGRQVAVLLAASGAGNITVFDPDKVNKENLGVQGYGHADMLKYKVYALEDAIHAVDAAALVLTETRPFGKSESRVVWQSKFKERNVVFCCVDSIDARKEVFDCLIAEGFVGDTPGLLIDGRMAAELLRVWAWKTDAPQDDYRQTLFPSEEAFKAPCTGRTTLYSSYVVAGIMVGEFVKWLRGEEPTASQTFNLRASEHWCQ